jgi:hypothetical protein
MTSTITTFEATLAPCGRQQGGTRSVTEDHAGLSTEELSFSCGCRTSREEFHDGSVHHMVVNHHGKILVEEEFRGE